MENKTSDLERLELAGIVLSGLALLITIARFRARKNKA
jgi:hypothetical protein